MAIVFFHYHYIEGSRLIRVKIIIATEDLVIKKDVIGFKSEERWIYHSTSDVEEV